MDDPWKRIDKTVLDTSSSNCESKEFEDNFCSNTHKSDTDYSLRNKSTTFEPLPDSAAYLASLEKKLLKLTSKSKTHTNNEQRDLLFSLAGSRDGHMTRFLTSSEQTRLDDVDASLEETITSSVVRHIAPHLQAISSSELIHLLRADHLDEAHSEEGSLEQEPSTSQNSSPQ